MSILREDGGGPLPIHVAGELGLRSQTHYRNLSRARRRRTLMALGRCLRLCHLQTTGKTRPKYDPSTTQVQSNHSPSAIESAIENTNSTNVENSDRIGALPPGSTWDMARRARVSSLRRQVVYHCAPPRNLLAQAVGFQQFDTAKLDRPDAAYLRTAKIF